MRSTKWDHSGVLRLSHAKVPDYLANFALGKDVIRTQELRPGDLIDGFLKVQKAGSEKEVLDILKDYPNLPWETIPTEHHKSANVWKQIFANGQLKGQALVRNVVRLAKLGAFDDLQFAGDYAKALTDEDMMKRTRLHPINYLNASVAYTDGQVDRNGYGGRVPPTWKRNAKIASALDKGFHLAFKYIEPANKRTLVALDVSYSMSSPALGVDLSCAQVGAAVAMTIVRTEPYSDVRGFSSNGYGYGWGRNTELTDLGISPDQSFSEVMSRVQNRNFGGTDISLPFRWALDNRVELDTIVVITDNEVNSGTHPHKALQEYRRKMGLDTRLAVLGVAMNDFTVADPNDSGSADFAGFDSATPSLLADFSAGRL